MLSPTFQTKQDVLEAGFLFVSAKVLEYIIADGKTIGKIQRVDISGGSSFGYQFAIAGFKKTDGGWERLGLFGETSEVYVKQAKNKGGGQGAYYTNVMTGDAYNQALVSARQAINDAHRQTTTEADHAS